MGETANEPALAPAHVDDGDGPDLWHYLDIVKKRKWVILATAAVVITATVLYTLQQTPIYRATASAVVNPRAPQVFGNRVQEVVQLGSDNQWSNAEYHNTQVEILTSYDLAEQTVRRHELSTDPRLAPPREEGEGAASEKQRIAHATRVLNRAASAEMKKNSRILELFIRHPDPELAADLANAHIETYINANLDNRVEHSERASKFLSSELDAAEKALRRAEEKVSDFKKDNQVITVSLNDRLNIVAADLEKYTAALSDARIERIKLGTVRDQVERAEDIEDVLESPIFALTGNEAIDGLKTTYLNEKRKLLEQSESLGPLHPQRAAQEKKLDDIRADIEREKRLAVREINDQYEAVRANEREFQSEVDRLKQEALELDAKQVDFDRLTRAQQAARENYDMMRQRLRDSQLSGRNQLGNIEPNTRARVPRAPVEPDMRQNLAVAAVVALLLGLGLAFGLEQLDRTIRSPQDVEERAGAPLLGVIPDIADDTLPGGDREKVRARDRFVFDHPTSHAAECARSIRTNILFSGASRALKVLALTSPNPREGKTTSVLHVGTTMAQSGQRVLLVDTDMRKPRLHQSAGVSRGLGISSLMLGESSFDDAIQETDIPNLHVLPCGPTPPNPSELLLTPKFKEIIADLRGRYDRIILDSPPLQAVTDAIVLSRLSDGTIVVAKARRTPRDDLAKATKQLRDVDVHIVGVILNDLDLSDRKYGYYHYAYGYGENADPKPTAAAKS